MITQRLEQAFTRLHRLTARRGPTGEFVEAAGARLRVRLAGRRSGSTPCVVLAADPPNVLEHMDSAISALAAHVRVLAVELPGFGFSTVPGSFDGSIDSMATYLGALLDACGEGPYALALPCASGLVSIELAHRKPDLVSHVIGIQTASLAEQRAWAKRVDPGGLVARHVVGQLIVGLGRRPLARSWYRAALGDRSLLPRFLELTLDAYDRGATYPLATTFQALARQSDLPRIEQPTLAVWGALDRTHKRTDRASLQPGATVHVIDDAGHFPELERPQAFADAVVGFVRAN